MDFEQSDSQAKRLAKLLDGSEKALAFERDEVTRLYASLQVRVCACVCVCARVCV